jgi:Protein-tyrosine-phosphatase
MADLQVLTAAIEAGDRATATRVTTEAIQDGLNPQTILDAMVAAMAEVGIDISSQTPKVLTTHAVQVSDVVITMGCGDACPIFPGKRYLDWDLEDPAGQGVEAVRPIRDEIKARVQALLTELLPDESPAPSAHR